MFNQEKIIYHTYSLLYKIKLFSDIFLPKIFPVLIKINRFLANHFTSNNFHLIFQICLKNDLLLCLDQVVAVQIP